MTVLTFILFACCGPGSGFALPPEAATIFDRGGTAPPQEAPARKPQGQKAGAELRSYELRIPKSTCTLKMIAIPRTETGGGFWMSRVELPWEAYDVFAQGLDLSPLERKKAAADAVTRPSKPYLPPDRGYGHRGHPAISMTLQAAKKYCEWLSAKTGQTYRLPTEAEWEYAARGGVETPKRLSRAALDARSWHWDNAGEKTRPVGKKTANALGLHDLLGNVAEWCLAKDGKPVARGGSFEDEPAKLGWKRRQLQTSEWNASDPQIPKSAWWLADCNFVGIRLVRVPKSR